MDFYFPNKIMNNYRSYGFFTDLLVKTKALDNSQIVLDFEQTRLFDANMCAVLGAILYDLERRGNHIRFVNFQPNIQKQVGKLQQGRNNPTREYNWKKNLFCRHFFKNEENDLLEYIESKIFSGKVISDVDPQLKMAISLCLAEIFRNAYAHSKGRNVFLAHYYSVFKKRLYVTLVSRGKTLKEIVSRYEKKEYSGVEAILWAVKDGNSVMDQRKGSGLHTIRQFIAQNQGKMQIISADGVWKQVKQRTFYKPYQDEFPGTIITLEFNMA